jgi:hypothetical protein
MPSIRAIPGNVFSPYGSGLYGADRTSASVPGVLTARRIPYTFCPSKTFTNDNSAFSMFLEKKDNQLHHLKSKQYQKNSLFPSYNQILSTQ